MLTQQVLLVREIRRFKEVIIQTIELTLANSMNNLVSYYITLSRTEMYSACKDVAWADHVLKLLLKSTVISETKPGYES